MSCTHNVERPMEIPIDTLQVSLLRECSSPIDAWGHGHAAAQEQGDRPTALQYKRRGADERTVNSSRKWRRKRRADGRDGRGWPWVGRLLVLVLVLILILGAAEGGGRRWRRLLEEDSGVGRGEEVASIDQRRVMRETRASLDSYVAGRPRCRGRWIL